MTSTRIAAPALPALTLAETKSHLRIDGASDDDVIAALISAATDFLERDVGLALVDQTWRYYVDNGAPGCVIALARHPAKQIDAVTAWDDNGTAVNIPPQHWFLNTMTHPARLRFGDSLPVASVLNGLEIDVICGFGPTGADVPDTLRQALLALIAHWFEFRHAFGPSEQPVSIPDAYGRLVHSWRGVRL